MNGFQPPLPERTARARRRSAVAGLVAAQVFALTGTASARPEFPGIVQETLGLTCAPPCLICHTMPAPQLGDSADQPFADNVRAFAPNNFPNEDNLAAVIKDLETKNCVNPSDKGCTTMPCEQLCNADGSGEPDIAELISDQNPNNESTLPCPRYGCGALVAPARAARHLDGTAMLVLLGAFGMIVRRARRR